MASTMIPLYASFQVADKVCQAADAIIPDDLHGIPHEVLKGGASGAAGGAAFTGAAAAQSAAAVTALTSATTTTVAAAEGVAARHSPPHSRTSWQSRFRGIRKRSAVEAADDAAAAAAEAPAVRS
jgi:hypothetical protein